MALGASARSLRRWWLLGGGALLGVVAAIATPGSTGCIYHDTCIKVTSPGHDWCRNMALAVRWPTGGSFDDAVPILRTDGAAPRGCHCYNDAEDQIFEQGVPECKLEQFIDDLEQAARQECQSLVPPGFDHNCWTTSGSQASIVEGVFFEGAGACIGNCEYGGPPAGGSCPDPTPYECATGGDGDGCGSGDESDTSSGESGVDHTGGETSGGVVLDVDAFVSCDGHECEIEESFARDLRADPSPLVEQGTTLVHDPKARRLVLHGVEPGSLAHALGLRSGDRLESVSGIVIDDLGSALRAYEALEHETTLHVRVKRGTQWLDFTYTFVP